MSNSAASRKISVAPMMDWTDRHCRYFMRLLAPDVRLYTEMVTAEAIVNGDHRRLLAHDASESPLALQLGGNDPDTLARALRLALDFGYDEFNLNVGCPSDRVQSGRFGACLMLEPARVGECVAAMVDTCERPVTVKTRIGVDEHDDYEFLARFVSAVTRAGCECVIVHARKAILAGLSPRENREIPPLHYDVVYRLKQDFAETTVVVNGGIDSADAVGEHLARVDGVMIGRKAYRDPLFLHELQDRFLSGASASNTRPDPRVIVATMADYADRQIAGGARLHHITRHMLGLFNGRPGARRWRRYLSEHGMHPEAGGKVLHESLNVLGKAA